MSKVRTFSVVVGAALILCTAGSALAARANQPHFNKSVLAERHLDQIGRKLRATAAAVSLTQSVDPNTIEDGLSVACSAGGVSTSNTWMRRFDLDGDHGIAGQFCASSLDFGVEILAGGTDLTVATHCIGNGVNTPGIIDLGQLALQDSVTFSGTDGSLYFQNTAVGGCCTGATDDMVVEVTSEDCLGGGGCLQFWFGANDNGQTAPSYLGAADCGIVNPTDLALIGFPGDQIVMTVNGDDDSPGTPAIGPLGIMVMVVVLLGSSAFFLRRQVIG
jgi:hypothetical protein